MACTVSEALLATMKAHGVRRIFGVPAAQLGHVMKGASSDPDFTYITTRHEECAGHMAHSIAKTTGEVAACFGTVGPGAMNMVPGVAAAWADNIPMLVLTPNNQSYNVDPSRGLLQSVDHCGVYAPITKWSVPIRDAVSAPAAFDQAIRIAKSGRPGPVHIDLPCDIGGMECDFDPAALSQTQAPRPAASLHDLDRVVKALAAAKRPVLLAGGGVARSGATASFRRLLAATALPATSTLNGRGVVPDDYPHHIGSGGIIGGDAVIKALTEADLVLAVGAKFSSWIPINKPPLYPSPKGQKIIHVDISDRVAGRNIPADIIIQADAREFLDGVLPLVESARLNADPGWMASLAAAYAEYKGVVNSIADAKYTQGTQLLNEAAVARAISAQLPNDAIVAADGGQTFEWTHTFFHPASPHNLLFNPGMGHLGMGLPAAIAAKSAFPEKTVVCVTGDGAFGCTIQELETAVRYKLDIIIFVFNDSHWGMYKPLGEAMRSNSLSVFGTQLGYIDFAQVAKGFGCHGETVKTLEDIPGAYERAAAAGRPAVVNVEVDFTPHPIDMFWVGHVLEGANLIPPEMLPS
ncbi:MAG: thiamine pyrophosphate-binding protein [Parvularculaceae bacterium]